ncbi:MAG TPA: phospholipase [Microbacterium sp.]|nr:phospholipase [Microbacterium sp.]
MPNPQTRRAARSSRRKAFLPRSAAFGLTLGIIAFTGLTSTGAAVAATQIAPSPASAVAVAMQSAVKTLSEISDDAQSALAAAQAAVTDAKKVTADIEASGLDVGIKDTSVDTTALRTEIERLSALDVVPTLLLPGVTEDAATATRHVVAEVAKLRGALDAALEKKAAEEAAAAAAAAAQKAAEEAAAQAAAEAQRQAEAAAAALAAANTPEGAQVIAQQMASANYGWGDGEFSCLVSLWDKESGWNYQAYNDSSGATGIPQALPGSKMASAGSDWESNAVTQIAWGLGYIGAVYGSPCSAWGHSQSTNWY